jgi:hypothetical protein
MASSAETDGDGEFLLLKNLGNAPLGHWAKADAVPDHGDSVEPDTDFPGNDRNSGSPDCSHHPTPIGILAEQSSLDQIRRCDSMGNLMGLMGSISPGYVDLHDLCHAFSITTDSECQGLTGLC